MLKFSHVGAGAAGIAFLSLLLALQGSQESTTSGESDRLRGFMEPFLTAAHLHFEASAEIVVSERAAELCVDGMPALQPIPGHVEYWASGERYRYVSWADPQEYPGVQTQAAFDGEYFQLLLSDGTLARSRGNKSTLLPILPNPFFELFQFLRPLTDENSRTELQLTDLQNFKLTEEFLDVEWQPVPQEKLVTARFPGGIYDGRSYWHQVYWSTEDRAVPQRIERVSEDGIITSTEFRDFVPLETRNGVVYWPGQVIMRAFAEDGTETVRIEYLLGSFSLNDAFPDAVFHISPGAAERQWDDESGVFLVERET